MSVELVADQPCEHPVWAWLVSATPDGAVDVVCTLCGAVPDLDEPEEEGR